MQHEQRFNSTERYPVSRTKPKPVPNSLINHQLPKNLTYADPENSSRTARHPEDKLAELYDLIHYFRLGLSQERTQPRTPGLFKGKLGDVFLNYC